MVIKYFNFLLIKTISKRQNKNKKTKNNDTSKERRVKKEKTL